MVADISGLVDTDHGLISRRIFNDPEIYQQELRNVFARCWLFLCHDSQIPRPGDFFPPPWARTRCWWCATVQEPCARS